MKKMERKIFGDSCCCYRTFICLILCILIMALTVFPYFVCMLILIRINRKWINVFFFVKIISYIHWQNNQFHQYIDYRKLSYLHIINCISMLVNLKIIYFMEMLQLIFE